ADTGRLGQDRAEDPRMHALLLGHPGAVRLRVREVGVALGVLGGGDGGEDGAGAEAPREPSEHACARGGLAGSYRVTGVAQAMRPEGRMLLLDRGEPSVDVGDVRTRLAGGHGQVLERAVDLFLAVHEPARHVGRPHAGVPCRRGSGARAVGAHHPVPPDVRIEAPPCHTCSRTRRAAVDFSMPLRPLYPLRVDAPNCTRPSRMIAGRTTLPGWAAVVGVLVSGCHPRVWRTGDLGTGVPSPPPGNNWSLPPEVAERLFARAPAELVAMKHTTSGVARA